MGAAGSLIDSASRQVTIYREKQKLYALKGDESKFSKLDEALKERRTLAMARCENEIPEFKKRIRKAQRKLARSLPPAEMSLEGALENIDYLKDLRERLIAALDKSRGEAYGANPSDEVMDGVRALEDCDPWDPEYDALEKEVKASVKRLKQEEKQWCEEKIAKCTGWIKQLHPVARRMEAGIEIGREWADKLEAMIGPLNKIEVDSQETLARLEHELSTCDAVLVRIKSERLRLMVTSTLTDLVLFKPTGAVSEMNPARARWQKVIKKVIEQNRRKKERLLALENGGPRVSPRSAQPLEPSPSKPAKPVASKPDQPGRKAGGMSSHGTTKRTRLGKMEPFGGGGGGALRASILRGAGAAGVQVGERKSAWA